MKGAAMLIISLRGIKLGFCPGGGEGGVLHIVAYTGRLCPKGVPFSGFRDIKARDFTSLGI